MKMSEKTLLKKIEQAYKENYCNGSYKVETDVDFDNVTSYVLFYTYETGETIALDIDTTRLGEVKFYSPVHCYYISNFNNHRKSVINVLRMLFDLIDSNKKEMINYYAVKTEETEETTETSETAETTKSEKHYDDYTSEDFINAGIAKECTNCVDFCEEDCIENVECARGNDVFEGCKTVKSIREVDKVCGDCSHYNACMQGYQTVAPTCCMFDSLYKARTNPNWHHVSLKTLANIDRDMLDEKRQCYMYLYHLLKDFRKYAVEISRREVYFDLVRNVTKDIQQMYFNNKISIKAYNYASRRIELVSVEKNYFQSKSEQAFGYKESKRYSITLR